MNDADKKKIAQIEQSLLADKPWQLKGEASARSRPLNSLLFEDVDFEKRVKAPVITTETTEALEELIKQRILDNKFDDPQRRVKTTATDSTNQQIEVNAEKSKIGLAQVYEQELVSKATSDQARDGPEKTIETQLFALLRKLDALVDI